MTEEKKEKEIVFDINESFIHLKDYFGKIQSNFGGYEERLSQKQMIRTILQGYQDNEHVIVEAPTGTGKSMGYLLSFLSMWKQNNEENKPKVVIATNTIALQEQLMTKDIPLFKQMIEEDFKVSLVKGKSNYLCLSRYKNVADEDRAQFDSIEEARAFSDLQEEIYDIEKEEVKIGDRSEIKTDIDYSLWNKLNVDSDTCTKKKCPFYKECFFYKAKEQQKAADILVTNHALFFADLSVRIDTDFELADLVLPDYDYVVFDEAHHLEDVATDFLGTNISRLRFKRLTSEIEKQIVKGDLQEQFDTNIEKRELILENCKVLDIEVEDLFHKLVEYIEDLTTKRLLPKDINFVSIERIKDKMLRIYDLLEGSKNVMELSDEEEAVVNKLKNRLEQLNEELDIIITQRKPEHVYWMEAPVNKDNRHYWLTLNTCPISVADVLHDNLFERQKSVVLTSATMGTDNMKYIASRLGVPTYIGAMYHSPFNYQEQAKIYIPNETVSPKKDEFKKFLEKEILKVVQTSKGRSLVLFTSYYLMNEVYDNLRYKIERELGYKLLKQGDMQRTPLINAFREDTHSVLFATSSYWEGIDVPGESLSSVVITKLPFEVPNHPVIEARMEQLQRQGKNPFIHYSVPNAIMKFKQGVGRLIRSSSDKGLIAILDDRVVNMSYGKKFVDCLPPIPMVRTVEEAKDLFE